MAWKPISEAPFSGESFLAAVLVKNNKTGSQHFEYAILYMDEGRLFFSDPDVDTGWGAHDYEWCLPFDPPPVT